MKSLKELAREFLGVFVCFYVLAQVDVVLYVGVPTTRAQVLGVSMLAMSIALFCLAIPAVILKHRKLLLGVELICFALFVAIEFVAYVCFDMLINGDWVFLLLGTSWVEIKDFLSVCSIRILMIAAFCLLIICYVFFRCVRAGDGLGPRKIWARVAFVICMIAPYFISVTFYRYRGNDIGYVSGFGVFRFACDSAKKIALYRDFISVRNNPMFPPQFPCIQSETIRRNPIYVFGIGESLTRNHMSLYGYGRKTTPSLDSIKDRLIVYSDCVARYRYTELALASTYIHSNPESSNYDYSLPQAVCAAGYDCVRISMQISFSGRSIVDGILFNKVKSFGDYLGDLVAGKRYDDQLLPILEKELKEKRPLVIFLHFRGCHFNFGLRYPKDSYTVFADECKDAYSSLAEGGKLRFNQYDNSVFYADKILSRVIHMLDDTGRPAFFAFCSDHGESPASKFPRVKNSADVWEVPLFFWFSQAYQHLYPEVVDSVRNARHLPLQTDQLFGGYLTLLHISNPPAEDFLSSRFANRKRRIVDEDAMDYDAYVKNHEKE